MISSTLQYFIERLLGSVPQPNYCTETVLTTFSDSQLEQLGMVSQSIKIS
jgi:hypothetical protein